MEELSTLCRICHTRPPIYTCPRCSQRTCSLTCSKRHKTWSSCNGIRDPTVYKPRSELATPSGIDHDYNFLHAIEHGIERSEKEIVEERGLVRKQELEMARKGDVKVVDVRWKNERGGKREEPGEVCVRRSIEEKRIRVLHAPKGMSREKENSTKWSKNQRCINWTVEWFFFPLSPISPSPDQKSKPKRIVSKILDKHPLLTAFTSLLSDERRNAMTESEKKAVKKRKADELKFRSAKKARLALSSASPGTTIIQETFLQDPSTTEWNAIPLCPAEHSSDETITPPQPLSQPPQNKYKFYLHRPKTPSHLPKVLIPIHPSSTSALSSILCNRIILEYPTIYVFEISHSEIWDTEGKGKREQVPEGFMSDRDYRLEIGETVLEEALDTRMESGKKKDVRVHRLEEEITSVSDDSSSESSSSFDEDEEMEDGEIA